MAPEQTPTPEPRRARYVLTPWEYPDPRTGSPVRMFASEGAVSQDGSKPIFTCDCGAPLVWVKSKRTGKSYLATCFPRRSEYLSYYYVKSAPHTAEAHAERLAQREAFKQWDEPNAIAYEQAREAYERMQGGES